MSAVGAPLRNDNGSVPLSDRCTKVDKSPPRDPPHRLLWSTGGIVILLSLAAFAYWGLYGAGTLFDLVVALCT